MEEKTLTPSFGVPQDEHTLLPLPEEEKKLTTVGQRFSGFAMGHLMYSILLAVSFPVWIELCAAEVMLPLVGFCLMAAYFPLGYFMAALEEWTVPQSSREKCLAVVYPMAVAWLWVAVVLVAVFGNVEDIFFMAVVISLFLAAPSSGFVLIFGLVGDVAGFVLIGLLAGFLPPLFFAYGSFWQASRREQKNVKQKRIDLYETTN